MICQPSSRPFLVVGAQIRLVEPDHLDVRIMLRDEFLEQHCRGIILHGHIRQLLFGHRSVPRDHTVEIGGRAGDIGPPDREDRLILRRRIKIEQSRIADLARGHDPVFQACLMQDLTRVTGALQPSVAACGLGHFGIVRSIHRAIESKRGIVKGIPHDAMARPYTVAHRMLRGRPREGPRHEAGDLHPRLHRENRGAVRKIGPGLSEAMNCRRGIGPHHVAAQTVKKDKQKTWPRHGNPHIKSAN